MKIKILAFALCMVLCVGLLPTASVSAADVAVENIAIGKTLYPSSTMNGYKPEAVIDGDYNTVWARGNLGANENMMIDLGTEYRITSVLIHPRRDINQDMYRQRIAVEFSNTPDFSVKERILAVGDDPTPYGEPIEVVPSKTAYRYVRVIKTDIQILVLAEIEIYGYIPDPNESNLGEDVEGAYCEGPVTLLSQLGIMSNVNEEIFGIDHLMTRGDAAEAAARMTLGGVTGYEVAEVPFKDVPKTHKNYNGIAAAYYLGLISGDGNSRFRPDDYVTETEMVYMTMRAIGYSENVVGNATALMNWCTKLDILDDVEADSESGLMSRGNAAIMLYNALLAPTIEASMSTGENYYITDGLNTLSKKYGITLTEGIVLENSLTRLDGEAKANKNTANVSGKSLIDRNGKLDGFLGREIIYATQDDDPDLVVLAWLTGDDRVIQLDDSSLVSSASDIRNGYIKAEDENGRERKYSIDNDIAVVVNGYTDPYWQPEDLVVDGGRLTLINNDGDSAYDVVFADKYQLYYLNAVASDEESITLIASDGNKKTVSLEGLKITDGNGKALSASKIKSDCLVKLYETGTGENCKIEVFDTFKNGTLTALYNEKFVIDGVEYPLSSFFIKNRPTLNLKIGKAVKFFENNGEIIWVDEDNEAETDWVIAFSQASDADGVFTPTVRLKVFDENGAWNIYEIADKLKVDGVQKTKEQFLTMLNTEKTHNNWIYEKAFIRYKLTADKKIRELDTTVKNAAEDDFSLSTPTTIASGLYSKESAAFWLEHKQLAIVKNDTMMFVIPTVGGQYTTSSEYDDLYRVAASMTDVAGNRSSQAQNIDLYMTDEYGVPAFGVKKQGYSSATGGLSATGGDQTPNILVKEVSSELYDSEARIKITGKNLSTKADVSFYADEALTVIEAGLLYQEKYGSSCFNSRGEIQADAVNALSATEKERYLCDVTDIGIGDIIRYETVNSKARAIERVFDYEPTGLPDVTLTAADAAPVTWFAANGTYPTHYIAFNRFQLGSISSVTAKTFTVTSLKGQKETYLKSSVPVIYSLVNGRTSSIEEGSDIYEFADSNHKVIVYSYNATPKAVIVYEY